MPDMTRSKPLPAPDIEKEFKNTAGFLAWVASIVAPWLTVFTRGEFGRRFFRWRALFSLIGLFLASGLAPVIVYFIPVWLVMMTIRRFTASKHVHGQYVGYPGYLRLFGSWARYVEGALFTGVGYLLGVGLGWVVMGVGVAVLYEESIMDWELRNTQIDITDGDIMQQYMMERYMRERR